MIYESVVNIEIPKVSRGVKLKIDPENKTIETDARNARELEKAIWTARFNSEELLKYEPPSSPMYKGWTIKFLSEFDFLYRIYISPNEENK